MIVEGLYYYSSYNYFNRSGWVNIIIFDRQQITNKTTYYPKKIVCWAPHPDQSKSRLAIRNHSDRNKRHRPFSPDLRVFIRILSPTRISDSIRIRPTIGISDSRRFIRTLDRRIEPDVRTKRIEPEIRFDGMAPNSDWKFPKGKKWSPTNVYRNFTKFDCQTV